MEFVSDFGKLNILNNVILESVGVSFALPVNVYDLD